MSAIQSTRVSYAEDVLNAYGTLPDGSLPDGTLPDYEATFVSQSFPLASSALTMVAGQTVHATLTMLNAGAKAWDTNTQLGTTQPRDRTSVFADSTWLSPSRPAAVSETVAPGASFTFAWDFHAPCTPGTYLEYFNLVEQGVAWFSDPGQGGPPDDEIEAQIVVTASSTCVEDAGAEVPAEDGGASASVGSPDASSGATGATSGEEDASTSGGASSGAAGYGAAPGASGASGGSSSGGGCAMAAAPSSRCVPWLFALGFALVRARRRRS